MRPRINAETMHKVEALAEARGLKVSMALDAVIQIGLREAERGTQYELTSSGLLVAKLDTGNDQRTRSEPSIRTKRARTQATKRSPLTATTSTTQPPVNKPTSGNHQPEPRIQTTRNTSPLTETSPTTQPPASLRITQQLSREQIPEDVYDQLSEYEKECLQYAAFVLDPEEGVILRQDPPINSEGVRATVDAWRLIQNGFIKGDDPDFFDVFKW